jgi:predicted transcriptional regulator
MHLNKRGQWVRAAARERRSMERRERLEATKELLKEGHSIEEIALQLNVSGNTVRQYVKEVQPLLEREKVMDSLESKSDALYQEMTDLGIDGARDPAVFTKWVDKSIKWCKVMADRILHFRASGVDTSEVQSSIIEAVKNLESSLYSTIIGSFHSTFNSEENKKSIPESELTQFNKYMRKWVSRAEKKNLTPEEYATFKAETAEYESPDKIANITKILKKVEDALHYEKNTNKINAAKEEVAAKLGFTTAIFIEKKPSLTFWAPRMSHCEYLYSWSGKYVCCNKEVYLERCLAIRTVASRKYRWLVSSGFGSLDLGNC